MSSDMNIITIPEFVDMIRYTAVEDNIPVIAWGPSGVGKTEAVYQTAAALGAEVVDIRLAQYDSVDFRGVPSIIERMTTWSMPGTVPFKGNPNFVEDDHPIILFLDEANTGTSPAVLSLAYQLTNERRVGEHHLMDNVRIVLAANRESDRGVSTRMPAPLNARLCHVEIAPDVAAVTKHFAAKGIAPLGIAFLNFRKPLLHTHDPKSTNKVFATPRAWERAFRVFASERPLAVKNNTIAGLVGAGPAAEFWGFTEVWSKIVPLSAIKADPDNCRTPDRDDIRWATGVNISGDMSLETVGAYWRYLRRLPAEVIVLAWQMAIARDAALVTSAEFIDFSREYKGLLG